MIKMDFFCDKFTIIACGGISVPCYNFFLSFYILLCNPFKSNSYFANLTLKLTSYKIETNWLVFMIHFEQGGCLTPGFAALWVLSSTSRSSWMWQEQDLILQLSRAICLWAGMLVSLVCWPCPGSHALYFSERLIWKFGIFFDNKNHRIL